MRQCIFCNDEMDEEALHKCPVLNIVISTQSDPNLLVWHPDDEEKLEKVEQFSLSADRQFDAMLEEVYPNV